MDIRDYKAMNGESQQGTEKWEMTDEQLEKAGRKLCELRGENPDEVVPDDKAEYGCWLLPRWKRAAKNDIQDFLMMHESIAHGRKDA